MRRLSYLEIDDDAFDALAQRALEKRRSVRDQAAVELERVFRPGDNDGTDTVDRRPIRTAR